MESEHNVLNENESSVDIALTSELVLRSGDIERELTFTEVQADEALHNYSGLTLQWIQSGRGSFNWNPALRFLTTYLSQDNKPRWYILKSDSDFNERYEQDRERRQNRQ